MSDQEGENGNEQIAESDPKLEVEKPKVVEKKIESITSLQQDEIQRGVYQMSMVKKKILFCF